jgi:uncharacterized protein (TIGR03437 family)
MFQTFRLSKDLRHAILLLAVLAAATIPAASQTGSAPPATIDIDTSVTQPIVAGFSGVNADLGLPIEYWDYHFNALANAIGFGWVRFPGGTSSDIYNWQTGEDELEWYSEFPSDSGVAQASDTLSLVYGRGGARLIDAANRANLLGASLIICVNGFTDTPASAGLLAQYVKDNHIRVAAWELSNEPYLYTKSFFPTASFYLDLMKPYRDAIKAVDPGAIVSIFVTDQAHPGAITDTWTSEVAAYQDKYWDAISFHHYPPSSNGKFPQWMADECAVLVTRTTSVVEDLVKQVGPKGVKILNTEFDPSLPNGTPKSITVDTVWGGIYSAEYIMRMSTEPAMLHVGPSEIVHDAGVQVSNTNDTAVLNAAAADNPIDTLGLPFGFYLSAQAEGIAVLNSVLKDAVASNRTKVTGGDTVAATGLAPIPALYAMSYTSAQGATSVVITNKSRFPQRVTVKVNGASAEGPFHLQFITSPNADTKNESGSPTISVQTGTSSNPIKVPPFSVLRADLIADPVVKFENAASLEPGPVAPLEEVRVIFPTSLPAASQILITDSADKSFLVDLHLTSATQASFRMPVNVATGHAKAYVMAGQLRFFSGSMEIASAAPGIASANGNGAGAADANWFPNPEIVGKPTFACVDGVALSCLTTPFPANAYVSVLGTGICSAKSFKAYVAGVEVPAYSCVRYPGNPMDTVTIFVPDRLAGTGEASFYVVADGNASNMTTLNLAREPVDAGIAPRSWTQRKEPSAVADGSLLK